MKTLLEVDIDDELLRLVTLEAERRGKTVSELAELALRDSLPSGGNEGAEEE